MKITTKIVKSLCLILCIAFLFVSCKNNDKANSPSYIEENGFVFCLDEFDGTPLCNIFKCSMDKEITKIDIPANVNGVPVTGIGMGAFEGFTNLTSVTIPDSIKFIGALAFNGCRSLINITLPDGVERIGSYAFEGCSALTNINIPGCVTKIDEYAFVDCSGIENMTVSSNNKVYHSAGNCIIETATNTLIAGCKNSVIPDDGSVTIIGYSAFHGCTGPKNINIPGSVTEIDGSAFIGCSGIESMTVSTDNKVYHSAGNCIIETATQTLIRGCKTSVIPDDGSVAKIGSYAFFDCPGLTSINIPSSVTDMDWHAFNNCSDLESMTVSPDNKVYHSAGNCIIETCYQTLFAGCKTSVIPDDGSVKRIGICAFYKCTELTSINIPKCVYLIDKSAFASCTGLTSINIPDSVTDIGDSAFNGCTGLTSVNIPDSVTVIGYGAFQDCTGLKSLSISSSITQINHSMFSGCIGLTSVNIPNSVTEINANAFLDCTGLTSINIPDSVTILDESAFVSCDNLSSVTFGGTKAKWTAFKCMINNSVVVHCSDGDITYK